MFIGIVSTRKIKRGEELFLDYGTEYNTLSQPKPDNFMPSSKPTYVFPDFYDPKFKNKVTVDDILKSYTSPPSDDDDDSTYVPSITSSV